MLSDTEIRELAQKRVAFRTHAVVYVAVNLLLFGIWIAGRGQGGDAGTYWPLWAHLGWGIGLAAHGYSAYGAPGAASVAAEERKLREKYGGR